MHPEPSYWEREEWLKPPDLLIVGGGIVGASAALFYMKRFPAHDVLIVDKGFMPEGASTKNAGFACTGSMSELISDMAVADEETVLKRVERRWRGLKLLRETMGDDTIGYEHTGGHEIFTDPELFGICKKEIGVMNRHFSDRLGVEEVYRITTVEGYPAIYNRLEGALNSGKLMRSLHRRIAEIGVRTWWNRRVDFVDTGYVRFDDGTDLYPQKVVVAVNGYASGLTGLPVMPARGFVLITRPMEHLAWQGIFHHNRGYNYFRNVGNRLLLGGARDLAKEEETTDRFGTNPAIRDYLTEFANQVLHLPSGWEIDMEWSGIMGMTENKEPIIRQIKEGVWAAVGLSGMGIAIGMEVARELVDEFVS